MGLEERLETKLDYETVNSKGVKTIEIHAVVRDQSPKSASAMLLALADGLSQIPKAQITEQ